jgi:chemotaxis protein MotA
VENFSAVLEILGENLWGYNIIIFITAAIVAVIYIVTRVLAKDLSNYLKISHRIQGGKDGAAREKEITEDDIKNINKERWEILLDKRAGARAFYSWFEKLSSIFPMLGIVGTVWSLLPMVSDIDSMQLNFFVALTSTFWGMFFAILCKGFDAYLSARMEENDDEVDRYMIERERYLTGLRDGHEA